MARLLTRPRSPFFYVEFKTSTGEIRRETTKCRTDSREGERAANRILARYCEGEKTAGSWPRGSAWTDWVVAFIRQHTINSANTRRSYLQRWNTVHMFLRQRRIDYPCQFAYAHVQEYLAWRTTGDRPVSNSTVRDELDTLSLVLKEAIRREFCADNPCSMLRLKYAPRRERPEITNEQAEQIRGALASGKWPPWMKVQFEIGWHTGRRISETRIAMSTLDLRRCTYQVRVKGGKVKVKPFPRGLLPIFRGIKGEFTFSVGLQHSHKMWRKLFDSLGMMETDFHCLRVSFISRCRRAGLDRWTCRQLVDHASALINAHYNRYNEADLRAAVAKLDPPKASRRLVGRR